MDFKILKQITPRRIITKTIQKFPAPMDNREVTTLGVQIWFPEEKKLLMLA